MTLREIVSRLRKDPADAWYYVQGNIRLFIYRRRPWLIRRHIREQFEYRKTAANECYTGGACKCCGCETPGVFFADKGCAIAKKVQCSHFGKPCYPKMMGRRAWSIYKKFI